MACSGCGADAYPSAKFCPHCGQPQQAVCPSCAAPVVAPNAAFCAECGTTLRSPAWAGAATPALPGPRASAELAATAAERRVCSVLFADLVGFTPLSEARDPEEVRELLSRYFDVARTVVGRYGGIVEKFIGDAVMAVWGTPVATEGDAERAVRAGLDLVDAVTALGVETGIVGLDARAGVVTGEVAVTVGAVGEGMVAGDAVNTAARVQGTAAPGSVFADGTTRRLAAAAVGFDDAGDHLLKGKAEPERLWRATRVLAGVGGTQRVDGLEAAVVGRDAELRLIKELLHAAIDRRTPRLVVVAGAAGVGKSRLGWEFEKYIDGLAQRMAWHRGRCLSYGEGVAFWALAEAVRQRLGIADEDPTGVAAEKLAAGLARIVTDPVERGYVAVRIGRLLGVPVAGDDGAALAREELFAGWRIFFERLAADRPVILLVEDAHYADTGLLDFLDHLVDWARDLPIYVLVLARPEIEERRAGFGVGRNRTMLALDPLDAASMDALVDALVPGMPPAARAAITSHAQGVPLFAVETVRSLVDRDIVRPVGGAYRLVGDVGELTVPDSLHGLLAARLDALEPAVRALVADAAVLGVSFPAEALMAVSDQPEDAIRAGLAELLRREVLEVSADPLSPQRGEYRFAQQLLRQVGYDTLSRRDRKTRHLAVAVHLRSAFADDGEEVADAIARHYRDALAAVPEDSDVAEIRAEAIGMSVRAAERALRAGAPAVAATSYATAAELAADADSDDAATLWELAAEAAMHAAEYDAAGGYAEQALALHRAAGRDRAAARAQVLVARFLRNIGRHAAARDLLTAAVEVLRVDPDADTVEALKHLGNLEIFDGGPAADRLSAETLDLGQALDVGDGMLANLLVNRGLAHAVANRTTQAVACYDYAAKLADRVGDSRIRGRALLNMSDTLVAFDPPAAAEAARTAIDLLRRVGAPAELGMAIANLLEMLLSTGEWDEAEAVLADALGRDGLDHGYLNVQRGRLAALRGDHPKAAAVLDALPSLLRDSEDPQDRTTVALLEAFVADAAGDDAGALEHARSVFANLTVLGVRCEQVRWAWPLAARVAHRSGDVGAARELVALLDGYAIGHLPPVLRSERELSRARLAAGGEPGAAARLFDSAVGGLRRLPAPYHLAHALLDRADWLAATNDLAGTDRDTAEAAEIAARLRAAPLAARVEQVRDAAGPVTAREHETV